MPMNPQGKVCVISQPTFLPWLGWFDMADQADTVVILDDVAFSKQSWQQRNRIRSPRGLELLSVPVKTTGRLGQRIYECEIAGHHFVRKMIATLQVNYSRARWGCMLDEFAQVMVKAAETCQLVELNCVLIEWISLQLQVITPMIRASTLSVGGQRGSHVAEICNILSARHYLSPAGAENYLLEDRAAFDALDISVWMHVYMHPEYAQLHAPFMPYACALDLIFNEGPNAATIMRSGRRPARPMGAIQSCKEQIS